jgi:hypothetical protein
MANPGLDTRKFLLTGRTSMIFMSGSMRHHFAMARISIVVIIVVVVIAIFKILFRLTPDLVSTTFSEGSGGKNGPQPSTSTPQQVMIPY